MTVNIKSKAARIVAAGQCLTLIGCGENQNDSKEEHNASRARTYANPLDIDYTYSIVNTHTGVQEPD